MAPRDRSLTNWFDHLSPAAPTLGVVLASALPACTLLACAQPPPDVATTATQTTEPEAITWSRSDTVGTVLTVYWQAEPSSVTWVEYRWDETWQTTPQREAPDGPHSELLLGIPYDSEVVFRVVQERDGAQVTSAELPASTGPLPEDIGTPTLLILDETGVDTDHPYVFAGLTPLGDAFYDDWWTLIFDRQGRVVWALEAPRGFAAMHPRVSHGGDTFLIDRNSFWGSLNGGEDGYIDRVTIDGEIVETVPTPWLRHAFTDMPDGSIVWSAIDDGMSETLDKRAPDGTLTEIWNCRQYLARYEINGGCSSNTVNYEPRTDTFLFSIFTVDLVVEVDHGSGEALRHFGSRTGAWGFSPADSVFWYQHNPTYTEAGTLLLSTETEEGAHETIVREYRLDEENEQLVEIWNFGIGDGIWADNMGEAHRLPGGNTLHNTGETARLREVTPDGEVVWDIDWGGPRVIGRSTPISDLYAFAP